jgi:hypothetical protein
MRGVGEIIGRRKTSVSCARLALFDEKQRGSDHYGPDAGPEPLGLGYPFIGVRWLWGAEANEAALQRKLRDLLGSWPISAPQQSISRCCAGRALAAVPAVQDAVDAIP